MVDAFLNRLNIKKSIIISCFLAGCLEMYDFVIFGFFALILHKHYFSYMDAESALLISYALFAVGFVFRPIGSLIFGYIGDTYGRKPALVMSVSCMGLASLSMFILPSYEAIGVSACYLIAIIRMVQGLSVGGEYNGVTIYAIEHSKGVNVGLIGSLVTIGSTLGVLLASIVSGVVTHPSLPSYSWRFAFLLGFGLSIVGYFIRKNLRETPEFIKLKKNKKEIPLVSSIKKMPSKFIAGILLSAVNNANVYYIMVFAPNYLNAKNNMSLGVLMIGIVFLCVPLIGYISDYIDRKKIFLLATISSSILNIFALDLMASLGNEIQIVTLAICAGVVLSMLVSSVNVLIVEIFPAYCRYSCTAVCYALGAAIFGGTIPMICTLIIKYFGDEPLYFGMYLCAISMLGVIAYWLLQQDSSRKKSVINVVNKELIDGLEGNNPSSALYN